MRLLLVLLVCVSVSAVRAQEADAADPPPTAEPVVPAAPPAPSPPASAPAPRAPDKGPRKSLRTRTPGGVPLGSFPGAPEPTPGTVTVGRPGAPSLPGPAAAPGSEKERALLTARRFFTALMASDAQGATALSAVPFQLEQRRIASAEELAQEWRKALRGKRLDLVTVYGIEAVAGAEMEKRYGKPPERLRSLPYREPHAFVAIANLSGHAALAIVRPDEVGEFRVVGYTD